MAAELGLVKASEPCGCDGGEQFGSVFLRAGENICASPPLVLVLLSFILLVICAYIHSVPVST